MSESRNHAIYFLYKNQLLTKNQKHPELPGQQSVLQLLPGQHPWRGQGMTNGYRPIHIRHWAASSTKTTVAA